MSVDYQGINTYYQEHPPYLYDHTYDVTFPSLGRSAYEHVSLSFDPLASLSKNLYRGASLTTIINEMQTILVDPSDKILEDLVVLMFKTRDVRGAGERLIFRQMFNCIYAKYPALMFTMLDLIPRYGYWKDFFYLALTNYGLLQPAMAIAYNQLMMDERSLADGKPLSLFAKWVPKEGKANSRFAKEFSNYIYSNSDMSYSQKMSALRRRVTKLNAALNTVETLQASKRWDEIEPSSVPKIAAKKSRAAFMNESCLHYGHAVRIRHPHDEKRLICRSKFENFVPAPSSYSYMEDSSRYAPVRERVIAGLKDLRHL
jgi:hypothetical protein